MKHLLRRLVLAAAVAATLVLAGLGARDVVTRIVFPDHAISFDPLGLLVGRLQAAYIPTVIKSIQAGTVTIDSTGSGTATITSVSTSNSVLLCNGMSTPDTNAQLTKVYGHLVLTNATTITGTKTDLVTTVTAAFQVLEFRPAVLKSLQRGTITLTSQASNTATITSVNTAKALVVWGCYRTTTATDNASAKVVLTNATTVTASQGDASPAVTVVAYQVPEFY